MEAATFLAECLVMLAIWNSRRKCSRSSSADAGGIGGPMCAQLSTDFGIYATRVNNGSPARKKDEYANADAEKWAEKHEDKSNACR
jgi:hypothetical protein